MFSNTAGSRERLQLRCHLRWGRGADAALFDCRQNYRNFWEELAAVTLNEVNGWRANAND